MAVTQHDIARLANVSQATVSRVLAGDQRVAKSIKKRVLSVMKEHNYKPDTSARMLRNKKTNLIGLVVKRLAQGLSGDPFYSALIAEVMNDLAETDYRLCVQMVRSNEEQIEAYDEMLRTRRVDGVLLAESEAWDERIHRLQEDNFPFVLIGNPPDHAPVYSVDNDNVYAGRLATEHLISQGYQTVGMLAGPQGVTVCEDRIAGYRQAITAAGLDELVWRSDFGAEASYQIAKRLFLSNELPEALVVLDDFMAIGVLQMTREFSLTVPHQLGIVSFNDSLLCRITDCDITSVNLCIPDLVRNAVSKLIQIIEGEAEGEPTRTIIPCKLMVRCSSMLTEGCC